MIQPLLDYQAIEKEKLSLIATVEGGKVKRNLDETIKIIDGAKRTLLLLESEAKSTFTMYDSVKKNLSELVLKISDFQSAQEGKTEEEIQTTLTYLSTLATKLHGYESQLKEMQRKIDDKHKRFEETKVQVMQAQKAQQTLATQYQAAKGEIEGKVAEFDKQLKEKEKSVDAKLLERYKKKRASLPASNYQDVAVLLGANRCGGCHFELPLSMTHKVATDGYIICEECGKIIFRSEK